MKRLIALSAFLIIGLVAVGNERARATDYCQYLEYRAGCLVRPAVVIPPSIDVPGRGFILRQDLFDRNNPNNLRHDWPSPPRQPG
jgi:hypothetical protein